MYVDFTAYGLTSSLMRVKDQARFASLIAPSTHKFLGSIRGMTSLMRICSGRPTPEIMWATDASSVRQQLLITADNKLFHKTSV